MPESRPRSPAARPAPGRVPPWPPRGNPRRVRRRRRHRPETGRWLALGFAGVSVLVALIVFWPGGESAKPAPPTVTPAPVIADAPPPADTPVPSPTTVSAEPARTPAPAVECAGACLVRLPEPAPEAVSGLSERGLQPSYAAGGWLWAVAPAALIDELTAAGTPVTLVDGGGETLPLYIVRLPADPPANAEEIVASTGDIVDRVDDEFIVRPAHITPPIADLVAMGLAIEKLPPPRPAPPASLATAALAGPGLFADGVSTKELERTIVDLQQTGGHELGSRAFRTDENALAADYIARRMLDLGLTVHYQDFVAWDGSYALNVLGELPGSDPSKVYLVLAHYDTINLDGGPSPGADDNATGIAAMLEIARLLSTYQLRYPVHFLATTGEEEAMQGALAFAKVVAQEDTPYAGAFNLDSLGWLGRANQLVINGDDTTAGLQDLLVAINDAFGLGEELLIRQNPKIVADDNVLRDAGLPTVLIARALYGENPVHHTEDDVHAGVDLPSVKSAAELVLLTIAELETR